MNWFTDLFKSKKKLRAEREAEFNKQIERQRLVDRASAAARNVRSPTDSSRSSFSNDSSYIPYPPVHAMMAPSYHSSYSSSSDSCSSSSYSDSSSSDSGSCGGDSGGSWV